MGCTASERLASCLIQLFCRQFQKFLVRLDALGHKLPIPEQCVCCDRCGHILCRLFLCNVDGFERDSMFLCSLLHLWHPIIGVGALVGIVEDKAVFLHLGMLGAGLEFWRLGTLCKGQVHEVDAAIGDVRNLEALMGQKLGVGEKLPFAPLCTQNANTVFALRLGIPKAFFQQLTGIAVPFQGAGDPQTVDIKPVSLCFKTLHTIMAELRLPKR